jgi:hypothetical protein
MSEKRAGYVLVSVILAIMIAFIIGIGYVQCAGKVMIPYQTIKHDTVMVEVQVDHVVDQDMGNRTDTVIRVDTVIKPVRGRAIIEYHTDTVYQEKVKHDTLVEYKYLKEKENIVRLTCNIIAVLFLIVILISGAWYLLFRK